MDEGSSPSDKPTIDEARPREAVILIHGLAAHPLMMSLLARRLQPSFARVVNWGYRSIWSPVEQFSEQFESVLRSVDDDPAIDKLHLVTHSMGGIVTRLTLERYQPRKLGRMVMVAPPNAGSRVAAKLSPWLGRICPPLTQLTDDTTSFVCTLPHPERLEVGVIAASFDYVVSEPSTHLKCECDHIVLPGLHSSVLWTKETAEQVRRFLLDGHFDRSENARPESRSSSARA
jgi:pimeloyl-ACP methyl ester carboxylesterase